MKIQFDEAEIQLIQQTARTLPQEFIPAFRALGAGKQTRATAYRDLHTAITRALNFLRQRIDRVA